MVPNAKSKVLGEQPIDLDTKIESTTLKTNKTNEGMVIDAVSNPTVTSTLEPESPKKSISSDDFFQELDEERKLADSVQQYYSTLKIERDPYIFKDKPFKPKNKKQNLNTDSMIVETSSKKPINFNSMGNLVEQESFTMKQFRAPFVLGLWVVCLLLIFGSFATALIATTTFITLFVYFGDMLSNTSIELVKTVSAVWSTISLIVSDFYSFISNYIVIRRQPFINCQVQRDSQKPTLCMTNKKALFDMNPTFHTQWKVPLTIIKSHYELKIKVRYSVK
jgi:hypothetical protein